MNPGEKMCLLNPGPVTLSGRVRQALLGPDLCHREPKYADLQADIRSRLARVHPAGGDDFRAVLLTGSGTAAVEAMVGSLVPRSARTVVAVNGVYGERIVSILHAQGKECEVVRSSWTAPIDLGLIEQRLRGDGRPAFVLAVHHETTTGRLNDLAELGALCRQRGAALLLDAVSSFAGEEIDFAGWNVEACAATANKCLHGVPGVAFVLARRSALEGRPSAACSVYLDLHANYQAQEKGYPQFTPSVQAMYALHEALRELDEAGGWQTRRAHYRALSRRVREGMQTRGVRRLLEDEASCSSTLTAFLLPKQQAFWPLYERLKRAGYVIYPGQQTLAESIFRVAVMGDLSQQDMEGFLAAFTAACGGG